MTSDRYTRTVLTLIALALAVIAVRPWLPPAGWLDAVAPERALAQGVAAKYEVTVPKAWGKFIGYSNNNLLLEAPDGSFKIVDVEGKPPEYPKIKVLIHWQ